MIHRTPTAGMTRQEWLAERRKSLGGSDMGAVLGMHRYSSPYAVWAEKTGRLPDEEDNEAMRQGRDLEDYVARRFMEKSGKKVRRLNAILRNDEYPHLHANIDRDVVGEDSGLECKTASALSSRRFAGGDFPENYYCQCVTYLAVTGYRRWYLAVLILGKGFQIYQMTTVPEDEVPAWCESSTYVGPEEIAALTRAAEHFWVSYVEQDSPPPVDGLSATTKAMETIYAEDNGGEVQLLDREGLFREYFDLKFAADRIAKEMDAIKQTIMEDLGQASTGACDGFSVTWKNQTRMLFDVNRFAKDHPGMDLSAYYKASISRPFKIKKEASSQ